MKTEEILTFKFKPLYKYLDWKDVKELQRIPTAKQEMLR
jgi:hypothetical protein